MKNLFEANNYKLKLFFYYHLATKNSTLKKKISEFLRESVSIVVAVLAFRRRTER